MSNPLTLFVLVSFLALPACDAVPNTQKDEVNTKIVQQHQPRGASSERFVELSTVLVQAYPMGKVNAESFRARIVDRM